MDSFRPRRGSAARKGADEAVGVRLPRLDPDTRSATHEGVMAERTKVKVGQVWTWKDSTESYRIVRVDTYYGNAFAERTGYDKPFEECFCGLDEEGYPIRSEVAESEWPHWTIVDPEAVPVAVAAQPGLTFAQWLTAPRPGNCVCDIPRHQCRFHR